MEESFKEFMEPFNNKCKNYMRLKSYYHLTNQMVHELSKILKKYHHISQSYINKLKDLNSNFSILIENYKTSLKFSEGIINDLIELLQNITTIFTT